jgi:hypothetical protein
MPTAYIHYGSSQYDSEKFMPIKNRLLSVKPEGGMWGSLENASYGWKEWCKGQDFHTYKLEKHFIFTLAPNANILQINSKDDLLTLPKAESPIVNGKEFPTSIMPWVLLDFEKLLADGVDAIQLNMSSDTASKYNDSLYQTLYGWDCDSLLVMNKDVIICEGAE